MQKTFIFPAHLPILDPYLFPTLSFVIFQNLGEGIIAVNAKHSIITILGDLTSCEFLHTAV